MTSIVKARIRANGKPPNFRRFFRHWRSGKIYDAWHYGYKSWPIGGRSR